MDAMDQVVEIVKLILPAIVVVVAVHFVLKRFMEQERARTMFEQKKLTGDKLHAQRLQAYERLILFLERIKPENLVIRIHRHGMSGKLLQSELLKAVREEYEHNLVQQMYISEGAWDQVHRAKDDTVKLFNMASTQTKPNANGVDYSTKIFEMASQLDSAPSVPAANFLKKEFRKNFF